MGSLDATRITIPDTVLHQPLDGETVLLHLTTEQYYGLGELGSRIWQLLQEHATVDAIVAILVSEYEVDEATLRSDLDGLLGHLTDLGLIHVEPGPSG